MDSIHVNIEKQSIIFCFSFRNQNYVWGKSCTHTKGDGGGLTNPFWRVDLGAAYNIGKVTIYNRGECCGK